jgi:hypothetical protein
MKSSHAPAVSRLQITAEVTVNECTVLCKDCGVGRGWGYVTEVTYAT